MEISEEEELSGEGLRGRRRVELGEAAGVGF